MDDEEISQIIQKTLGLVKDLPDEYRSKTYEILLNALLREHYPQLAEPVVEKRDDAAAVNESEFSVPIDLKAFLVQNNLTEDMLWRLFLIDGDEIRPVYKLKTERKATAVIQVACLLALEEALMGGSFEFSVEDVRSRVQELDLYDATNFLPTFKTRRNKSFFGSLEDLEKVPLSPAGKTELADIIEELTQ